MIVALLGKALVAFPSWDGGEILGCVKGGGIRSQGGGCSFFTPVHEGAEDKIQKGGFSTLGMGLLITRRGYKQF